MLGARVNPVDDASIYSPSSLCQSRYKLIPF